MFKKNFNTLSPKTQGFLAIALGILLFVSAEFSEDYLEALNFFQRLLIKMIFEAPGIFLILWGWKSIKK